MRRRITTFTIDTANNALVLDGDITIDDIRLIINETQNKVICSSMQKANVTISDKTVVVKDSVCKLAEGDHITFETDTADGLEYVSNAISKSEAAIKAEIAQIPTVEQNQKGLATSQDVAAAVESLRGEYSSPPKTTLSYLRSMLDALDIESILEGKRNIAAVLKTKGATALYQNPDNPTLNELINAAQQVRVNEFISVGNLEDEESYTPDNYKLPDEWKRHGTYFAYFYEVARLFQEDITSGAFDDEFSSSRYTSRVNPGVTYKGFYVKEIYFSSITYNTGSKAYAISLTKGSEGEAYLVGLKTKQLVEWSSEETDATKNLLFQLNDIPDNGRIFVFGLFTSDNYTVSLSNLTVKGLIFGGHPASISLTSVAVSSTSMIVQLNECDAVDVTTENISGNIALNQKYGYASSTSGPYATLSSISLPITTHLGNNRNGDSVHNVLYAGGNNGVVRAYSLQTIWLPKLSTISSGGILFYAGLISFLSLPELTRVSLDTSIGGEATQGTAFIAAHCPQLFRLELPKLTYFSGSAITSDTPILQTVIAPELEEIYQNDTSDGGITACINCKHVYLPKLKKLYSAGTNFVTFRCTSIDLPALEELTMSGTYNKLFYGDIYLPSLKKLVTNGNASLQQESLSGQTVWLPALEVHNKGGRCMFGYPYNASTDNSQPKPARVIIGCKGTTSQSIYIDAQIATNCNTYIEIGDKENIDKGLEPRWKPKQPIYIVNFNGISAESIALGVLDRLADNSDGTPIPIVVGSANLSRINADETYAPYVQAARDKGYTIS